MFCLFGLNLLFDALQDPARARQVESLYGFRQKDLAALTGHYDVFSLQNNPDSDVRRLASWLARLRDTLAPPNSTRNRVLKEFFKYIQYPFKKIR
jgi:hypothetical protein